MNVAPFLGSQEKAKSDFEISQKVKAEAGYWDPILMGVVSREEMEVANMEDMQFYNKLAERKQKLMGLGGDEDE